MKGKELSNCAFYLDQAIGAIINLQGAIKLIGKFASELDLVPNNDDIDLTSPFQAAIMGVIDSVDWVEKTKEELKEELQRQTESRGQEVHPNQDSDEELEKV